MAGVPVLTSPLPAMVEVVKSHEAGQILPSLEPEEIGKSINAMLADPATLAQMSSNALEATREEYNWEKECEKLIALYRSIFPDGAAEKSHDQTPISAGSK
jgi:glycosyltransferase involved in cell wall biosynthesis